MSKKIPRTGLPVKFLQKSFAKKTIFVGSKKLPWKLAVRCKRVHQNSSGSEVESTFVAVANTRKEAERVRFLWMIDHLNLFHAHELPK